MIQLDLDLSEERAFEIACQKIRAYKGFRTALEDGNLRLAHHYASWNFALDDAVRASLTGDFAEKVAELTGNETPKP